MSDQLFLPPGEGRSPPTLLPLKYHTHPTNLLGGAFLNISHDVNQPYNQAIVSGQNQVLPNYTTVEWLPRFGFTWTPFGLKGAVVRGGFGLFADSFPGTVADQSLSNPPLQAGFNIAGGALSPAVSGNQAQLAA